MSGIKSKKTIMQKVPYSQYESLKKDFKTKDLIIENSTEDLKKRVIVPFYREKELIGFFTIENPISENEQLEQLKTLGNYLSVLFTRRDLTMKIKNDNEAIKTLMDDVPGGFLRVQILDDGRLKNVFVNKTLCKLREMSFEQIMQENHYEQMSAIHPDDIKRVRSILKQMVESKEMYNSQYRVKKADGTYVPLNVFARITENEQGKFINIYYSEMSEKEKNELTIREALPFILSTIMKSSVNLDFVKDKNFRYLCCSSAFAKFAGQSDESQVIGKTDYDLFAEDVAKQFREDDLKIFKEGKSLVEYTEKIPSNDGIQHYSRTSKYILRDSTGEIIGLYGNGRDITDIRMAFDRLKLLTDSILGGIACYTMSKDEIAITYYNDGFCKMLGCTREEYEKITKEKGVLSYIFKEDLPLLQEKINKFVEDGKQIDCVYRVNKLDKTGYIWVNLRCVLIERTNDKIVCNAVLYDITNYYEALQKLRATDDKMNVIMNNIDGGIAAMTINNGKLNYLFFNERYCKIFGYTKEQFIEEVPNGMMDLVIKEDFKKINNAVINNEEKQGTTTIDVRVKCRDKSIKWIRSSGTICHINGIEETIHAAVIYDITDEIKKKEELRIKAEEYMIAVEGSVNLIYRYSHKSNSIDFTSNHALMFENKTHIDNIFESIINDESIAKECVKPYEDFFNAIRRGDKEGEIMLKRKNLDGQWRMLKGKFVNVFDDDNNPVSAIITFLDITKNN